MIIQNLHAQNFRKYRSLELTNLPERGLIVVSGGNESGKTSIGDAIGFALFGCTDTLEEARTGKLVQWGNEQAVVTLDFQHRGQHYRLERKVDKAGQQSAVLTQQGNNEALATTPAEITSQLKNLLGYGYPAFIRTFYWGQQAAADTRADTESLQAMAGVKAYAYLDQQLQHEQQDDHDAMQTLEAALAARQADCDLAAVDEQHLPDLLEIRETLEDQQQSSLGLLQNIRQNSGAYPEQHVSYHQLLGKSRWLGWLSSVGIGLLLLILAVWAVMTFFPAWMEATWPASMADSWLVRLLLWGGVIIAVMTSLVLFYGWHIERNRLRPLRSQADALGSNLQSGARHLGQAMPELLGDKASAYLQKQGLLSDTESGDLPENPLPEPWPEQVKLFAATPDDVLQAAQKVTTGLEERGGMLDNYLHTMQADVASERERVEQYNALKGEITRQQQHIAQYQHGLQVKEKALELVRKASRHAISRFNAVVHRRCQDLLTQFTQSHYQKLELDNDFALHVLSEEKGSYLDFEEISAGTRRQIGLAMRIALANSLAESSDTDLQFMYLDEPFAFFDEQRTTATLDSLKETTRGKLSQVWVTVQSAPERLGTTRLIRCIPGENTLEDHG